MANNWKPKAIPEVLTYIGLVKRRALSFAYMRQTIVLYLRPVLNPKSYDGEKERLKVNRKERQRERRT